MVSPLAALFRRRIDSQAIGAFRIAFAAVGLFYVSGAITLVDVAWPARQAHYTGRYEIWLCVLALLLVGFHSRAMAIGSFLLMLVCNSNPMAGAVGELLWRIAAFSLLFMDSGASLSIDELRARWRGVPPSPDQPRWPADLAVFGVGVALMLAGLPKMLDPVWRQGNGFYLAMLLPWTHYPWADRIAGSRALTLISNYIGIASETGFVFLIFVPYLRWLAVAMFAGLMAGFGILMSFYFIGAAGISFLPLMLPDSQGRWPWRPRVSSLRILYDGACGFCDQSVRLLRTLDSWNRVTPQPIQDAMPLLDAHGIAADTALDQMHIVEGDRIFHGFHAFRRFARATPYLLPIAPLLYVPGVPQLGQLVYSAIARRRYRISCAIGGPRGLPAMTPAAARPPAVLARLFATSHLVYILIFAAASVRAVFGAPSSLQRLSEVRVVHEYNSFTNDIRPLPLFCEMHLFGVFVYRIQGTTETGDSVELLPVFDEHGRPGPCCAAGPRYLEGLIFHVTDDAIGRGTSHWFVPELGHMATYRAVMERAARDAPAKVRSVRMLIKVLNPPRQFEGRVAPWDTEPWVPWLQYQIRDGRVVDGEWLETPPKPAYTVR